MSYPGKHHKGPIRSEKGFGVGTKDSNSDVIDESGNIISKNGTKMVMTSQTIKLSTVGAAGTYAADILLPAGHIIHNISVVAVALSNAGTSSTLDIGDYSNAATPVAIDADGFFAAINLKATDLLAGEGIDFYRTGGKQGAYLPYTTNGQNAASHVNKLYSADARRIRASCTTVGTAATTGETLITVLYSVPEFIAN